MRLTVGSVLPLLNNCTHEDKFKTDYDAYLQGMSA